MPQVTDSRLAPDQHVLAEQVAEVFRLAPAGLLGSLFAATVVWMVLLPLGQFAAASVWYVSLCVIVLLRMQLVRQFYSAPPRPERSLYWGNLFAAMAMAGALLWAVPGTLLLPPDHLQHEAVIGAILAGVAAVAVSLLAPLRHACFGFLFGLLGPVGLYAISAGGALNTYIGMSALVYLVVLLAIASRTHQGRAERIALRNRNDQLLASLTRTKAQTDATTRVLADIESQRARAEAEVRDHRQRLDVMIQQTPIACIEWTPDFHIKEWNPAAERMFGYARAEVLGRNGIDLIVAEDGRAVLRDQFAHLLSGDGPQHGVQRNVSKDGKVLRCEWYNTVVRDDSGRLTDLVSLVLDVTERSRLDRMKNEFIRTVSHELRTPLTSVQGALGLLAGGVAGPLSQQAIDLVQIAETNSKRLLRLVDDLLDMEKIQSGRAAYRMDWFDLGVLVSQAVGNCRPLAEQFDVPLRGAHPEGTIWLRADPARIIQALTNVVSNAIKFSPGGQPVDVQVRRLSPGTARIAVADRGPGIPEDFLPHIYDTFTQADASMSRSREGTGLGLTIAKEIVEGHGGHLSFESKVNAGTTFFIDFPVSDTPVAPAEDPPVDDAQVQVRA